MSERVSQVRGVLAEQVARSGGNAVQLLTIDEAARILACTPAAIRKWLAQRRLSRVKMGRLTRLRLEEIEWVAVQGLPKALENRLRPAGTPRSDVLKADDPLSLDCRQSGA